MRVALNHRLRGVCLAAVPLASAPLALASCDHFRVESFHGSRIEMTLSGTPASAAGRHLELWVRASPDDVHHDIIRVLASDGSREADGSPCQPADQFKTASRFAACAPLAPVT